MGRLQPQEPRRATCTICHDSMPTPELLDHLRLFHSDTDWEPDETIDMTDLDAELRGLLGS